MSVRDGLSERLLLDVLSEDLRARAAATPPAILLIGMQARQSVAEANALAGPERVHLLHLDQAAGAVGCGRGNQERLYGDDTDKPLTPDTFDIVGVNVEAARSYRVLRALLAEAVSWLRPGGSLLVAGPRKGGAEVAAETLRTLVEHVGLVIYRKGHRVYRASGKTVPAQRRGDEAAELPGREAPVMRVELRGQVLTLVQDERIFARGRLDPATRLLAETFQAPPGADLLDLGCGSGVLGILAALLDPTSRCTLVDADPLAVAAARRSAALSRASNVTVQLSDVLAALPGRMFDVVVMNPPFHRGRREDRALGERFLSEAAAALRPGGRLWVVCNRFLPYERTLQHVLGDVREAAGDRSYKVLTAVRITGTRETSPDTV